MLMFVISEKAGSLGKVAQYQNFVERWNHLCLKTEALLCTGCAIFSASVRMCYIFSISQNIYEPLGTNININILTFFFFFLPFSSRNGMS